MPTAYESLITEIKEISLLNSANSVLGWDERTQLPPKGAEHRGNQSSLLARMAHEKFTSKKVGDLLGEAEVAHRGALPDSDIGTNLREIRRGYDRATKIPPSLVEELSKTAVLAQAAWGEARAKSDYPMFKPWLEKTLDLKRQEIACIRRPGEAYDTLLDEFEPDETAANLRRVFQSLREPLVELIGKIQSSPRQAPIEILQRNYPAAAQERLARHAAAAVGFDFAAGRLDVSLHPFCTGIGPGDTRMTTRYDEHYFGDAFFGVLHETGHALYDQGLPQHEYFGTPLAEAVSLGIHESQSRMWENLIARSRAFWNYFLPKTKEAFPDALRDVSLDQWYFAVNDVRPSLIRTESDETTYNLHILLRFELEVDLIDQKLSPADLPEAWNQKIKTYLGIDVPSAGEGCLQDIHWSGGAFGYFPTYTLGNLYAAQFFEQMRTDVGDIDTMLARGEFAPLLSWLREKIHRHGKRYSAAQLVKNITGKELSAEPLLRHLRKKAAELYEV